MIIELCGLPGVGKFTIGTALAARLNARLLDNHSLYNVAFALTDFRSEHFDRTVRAVREIAWDAAAELSPDVPLILTTAFGSRRAWSEEWCEAVKALALRRDCPLLIVHLICEPNENRRRIGYVDRQAARKPTDPSVVDGQAQRIAMVDHGDDLLTLDVTHLTAQQAANEIERWVAKESRATRPLRTPSAPSSPRT